YKNIVEILLEDDLKVLEQAIEQSAPLSIRPQQALIDAVQLCLLSEANAQIGEGVEGTQRLKALGGLSDDYAQRLASGLRTAFQRLYFGQIALGTTIAVFAPSLLYVGAHLLQWTRAYVVETLG